jgi:hypothetical protein
MAFLGLIFISCRCSNKERELSCCMFFHL